MSQEKYCKYMEEKVICSSYNNNGSCRCLNCEEKKCESACSEVTHVALQEFLAQEEPELVCMCTECINNTLYHCGR